MKQNASSPNHLKPSNKKLVIILFAATIGMFGFGFALVPFYNTLCNILGINGKTNSVAIGYNEAYAAVDTTREVTVEFIATNPSNLNWDFYPLVQKIKLNPGKMKQLAFYARNRTDRAMTVQAVPSVTPGIAAKYLKKTECFCFTQQTLSGKAAMDMPLLFHIDPELPQNIHTITLSYTLYDVTDRNIKQNNKIKRIT